MMTRTSDCAPAAVAVSADVDSLQQAAEWYAALRGDDVTEDMRRQWRSWLERDPTHARAWQRIEAVSRRFAPLHTAGDAKSVLAGAQASLPGLAGRRHALRSLVGLVGAGIAGWLGWRHTDIPARIMAFNADYHTGVGEQRELHLPDGTRVWLNTASAVDVDYQRGHRTVHLRAGEILIQTASDAQHRPFFVSTLFGRIQALGTRFTVRQDETGARVDVFEGAVEIRNLSGAVRRIAAGEACRFDGGSVAASTKADPARQSWQAGVFIAGDITLEALLDELFRYRYGHVSVSPQVAGLKVIGVYPIHDMGQSLAMIESGLPVKISQSLPWWISITSAAK